VITGGCLSCRVLAKFVDVLKVRYIKFIHNLSNLNGEPKQQGEWFSSKETIKLLKISDCELMRRRELGDLEFKKRGHAYLYYFEIKDE